MKFIDNRSKILLLFFLLIFFFPSSLPGLELSKKGTISLEGWYFPQKGEGKELEGEGVLKGRLELSLNDFNLPLLLKLSAWGLADSNLPSRNRSELEDLYLDYFSDHFELRLGPQIFNWKAVESISPADFLNPLDFEVDFFDPPKLSLPALRLKFIGGEELDNVLTLYLLSPQRLSRITTDQKSRYSFPLSFDRDQAELEKRDYPELDFALRFSKTVSSFDLSLFYFLGYRRFPTFVPRVEGFNGPEQFQFISYQEQRWGLTFQGAVEGWLLKGEIMGISPVKNELIFEEFKGGEKKKDSLLQRSAYAALTAGFEYTFFGLISSHDLGIIGEYIYDGQDQKRDKKMVRNFLPFKDNFFWGLRYSLNDPWDSSFLGGVILERKWLAEPEITDSRDFLWQGEYSRRIGNNFYFTLKGELIRFSREDPELKKFNQASRIMAVLDYNF